MTIDFSKFNFTDEQIRNVRDLVWDKIIEAPEIAQYATLYPDVVTGKQVGFITAPDLIISKDTGCGSTPQDWKIGTDVISWEPVAWEAYIRECYADLEATMAVYSLKKGSDRANLEGTDYEYVVAEVMGEAIKQSIFALAWFGDKQSSDSHLNLFDGFLKQMDAQIAVNPAQSVEVDENDLINSMLDIYAAADPVLAHDETSKFYVSHKAYVKLLGALSSANASTKAFAFLLEGGKISILGKEVLELPLLDKHTSDPIFIFTAPKYLGVGVDETTFDGVRVDYEPSTKYTHLRSLGKMDVKLVRKGMFVRGKLA